MEAARCPARRRDAGRSGPPRRLGAATERSERLKKAWIPTTLFGGLGLGGLKHTTDQEKRSAISCCHSRLEVRKRGEALFCVLLERLQSQGVRDWSKKVLPDTRCGALLFLRLGGSCSYTNLLQQWKFAFFVAFCPPQVASHTVFESGTPESWGTWQLSQWSLSLRILSERRGRLRNLFGLAIVAPA